MHRASRDLPTSFLYILRLSVSCFYGISECENEWVSDSCAFSWKVFLLLVLLNSSVMVFILPYLLCNIPWKSVCFLMRDRKGVGGRGGGEELEGVEEGKL